MNALLLRLPASQVGGNRWLGGWDWSTLMKVARWVAATAMEQWRLVRENISCVLG